MERKNIDWGSLGFAYVEDKLLNGALDKKAVMEKTVVGGATC